MKTIEQVIERNGSDGNLIDAAYAARACSTWPDLVRALEEIAKGKGPFSKDPLCHAENCITSMKEVARDALAEALKE